MKRPPSAAGPRMLKRKDSPEFAWQTWQYVKTCYESKKITIERFTQALDEAETYRIYERIPPGYKSLDDLLMANLGVSMEESIEHKQLRANAGRPKKTEGKTLVTKGFSYGEDTEYLKARIARDRPDILEAMKTGKYKSVRAAALDAGIVRQRISVPLDVAGAARALRRHLTPDEIAELIALLSE